MDGADTLKVTITFDNGPTAETTPAVLDVLARHGVAATFFVLGRQLADPELRRIALRAKAAGHRIGNHSYSHSTPFGELARAEEAVEEIVRTQALMSDLTETTPLFRPFGGGGRIDDCLFNQAAVNHLEREGYTIALWTSVPRDWEDPCGWVARARMDCATQPWSVIVLHDLPTGAMDELDAFLGDLVANGAEFSQDFPETTMPMQVGRANQALLPLIAG